MIWASIELHEKFSTLNLDELTKNISVKLMILLSIDYITIKSFKNYKWLFKTSFKHYDFWKNQNTN